ncbi:sulfotransferase 1E1 [Xylocopa sonorina]|uniref:sulfotransferase 1E1 n=1 Tax=Xylocopa sonorina TaxID=1818115 RepID=UPI00403AC7D1
MARQPPKYELLNEEETKKMLKLFRGERTGWVLVGPKKWLFPYKYVKEGEGFYNFKAKPDDTWVISYPRSGTTCTQELVWLLSNNLDFERAKTEFLMKRFSFLEFSMFYHPEVMEEFLKVNEGDKKKEEFCKRIAEPGYEVVANITGKRFIKSHFPFSLLPNVLESGCKVIYIARNPKDVAVSWYYLNKAIKTQGYIGDFATFWHYFKNDLTPWSPYWEHLKEAWAQRNNPNFLFIFYEDMLRDLPKTIKNVAKFLGKTYTEEQIKEVADYLDIKNFKNNPMVNASELVECNIIAPNIFVRKGKSDKSDSMFTPELDAEANEWIEENLKGTDLRFPS